MNLTYLLVWCYSYFNEMKCSMSKYMNDVYNDMEMLVLNNTFTEIYFYDYYKMDKVTLRNNAKVLKVLYLIMKKYWFNLDISNDIKLHDFFTPLALNSNLGIFEIVFFSDRRVTKYYTKGDLLDKDLVLHYMKKPCHKKFLYATINDKVNVTWFINEHISSFHNHNNITVLDITLILYINQHTIPEISEGNHYLKLIDDDTLDETIYKDNSNIILIRDE
jgi:hypothetical protein